MQLLFGSLLELLPNKYTVQPHRKMIMFTAQVALHAREQKKVQSNDNIALFS